MQMKATCSWPSLRVCVGVGMGLCVREGGEFVGDRLHRDGAGAVEADISKHGEADIFYAQPHICNVAMLLNLLPDIHKWNIRESAHKIVFILFV